MEGFFELGRVADAVVHDRQRRERDDRDARVHAEHGDQHEVDRLRHVVAGVLGLLGHVRDGLDAGVGDHRDRQREDQLVQVGAVPRWTWSTSSEGSSTSTTPRTTSSTCVQRSATARKRLSLADSPRPRMFSAGEQRDRDQPADDVAGVVGQRREERAEVVRHEERRDRDRDDVVEAQRPAGEERDDLVERVARERGGAAGLGEHRGALGVGLGGQHEQPAREHEHERRQPERVRGDQPERVVDRGADVAVGGREQAGDADRSAQSCSVGAPSARRYRRPARRTASGHGESRQDTVRRRRAPAHAKSHAPQRQGRNQPYDPDEPGPQRPPGTNRMRHGKGAPRQLRLR